MIYVCRAGLIFRRGYMIDRRGIKEIQSRGFTRNPTMAPIHSSASRVPRVVYPAIQARVGGALTRVSSL
jgi:hypothetical protein